MVQTQSVVSQLQALPPQMMYPQQEVFGQAFTAWPVPGPPVPPVPSTAAQLAKAATPEGEVNA